MPFPSKSYLEQLRKKYPVGTKLQLLSMRNEKYPVLPGTVGEITHIVVVCISHNHLAAIQSLFLLI